MAVDSDERRIEVAFRALRTADERSAPSFTRTWTRAASKRRHRGPGLIFAVRVAAVLVALGVIVWLSVSPGPISPDAAVPDVSAPAPLSWPSPTAFLLKPLDERLLSTVPRVRESVVNGLLDGHGENVPGGTPR